jgi:uncharacterized alkaline shock family protein YloU
VAEHGDVDVRTDAGERGTLTIRERAVERTALAAVRGVPGVSRDDATLRQLTGRRLPSVDVDVAGDHAIVRVDIAVEWGYPLQRLITDVRATLTDALNAHAGVSVDRVTVHVASITAGTGHRERRVS